MLASNVITERRYSIVDLKNISLDKRDSHSQWTSAIGRFIDWTESTVQMEVFPAPSELHASIVSNPIRRPTQMKVVLEAATKRKRW